MKRFFKIALAVAVALPVFAACSKEQGGGDTPGGSVAVTGVDILNQDSEVITGQTLNVSEKVGFFTVSASVKPADATNKKVSWESSNGSVATVAGVDGACTVTVVGKGEADIKVTTEDGGKTASFHLNVGDSSVVPVDFVMLDNDKLSLAVDGIATLVATVYPENATNKNVTWSSSDVNVATVEAGEVYGVSEGTATITVTTEDGGKTAECSVRVGGLPKIELVEEYFSTNAPMEYVSQGQGADEYGFGSPDWFNPISEDQTTARTNAFGLVSSMWDDDLTTCYHTNLDWGSTYSSWGVREGAMPGAKQSAYLQINFPDDYTTVQLKFTANTNEAGHKFGKTWSRGGTEFSSDGFRLFWSMDGEEFVLYEDEAQQIDSGAVYCPDYGSIAEVTLTATEDMPSIAAVRIQHQVNPADADPDGANDWTGTENAFGFAEIELRAE